MKARKYFNKAVVVSGFTLIELMIVVVIVGILAMVAYPSYTRYMIQARRSDGQAALLRIAAAQEKFFADCNWYAGQLGTARTCGTGPSSGVLGLSAVSVDQHYQLQVNATATAFTASAIPQNSQATDAECSALGITNTGGKTATGTNTSRCWRK